MLSQWILCSRDAALLRRALSGAARAMSSSTARTPESRRLGPVSADGRTLKDFLWESNSTARKTPAPPSAADIDTEQRPLRFFIETYGCQMNVADSEIVHAVLESGGLQKCDTLEDADVILANTCAIRDNAEHKIWHRIGYFNSLKVKNRLKRENLGFPVVGVLGCMAERLKEKLLEENGVDFVCGPDAYRDIPNLLNKVSGATDQKAANVQLSLDETYADIKPVRHVGSVAAFVSIMRGCNNMCSYCVVPFTRGRERSRDIESIVNEVRELSNEGVKELMLLGQNVNSYHDSSEYSLSMYPNGEYKSASGFKNLYRLRDGAGARFADLLDAVSSVDPEMRIRFTSPHPKDFPDEVLSLISERQNLCKSLHLPAQSGSTSVLKKMRRGYSRDAYDELVEKTRSLIPGVAISTDIIAGFCEETIQEHEETVDLMRKVKYDQAFMFAYSLRERTHAAHKLKDDVPEEEKLRRLQEIIAAFRDNVQEKNNLLVGTEMVVLVEGPSRKSTLESPTLTGRSDTNHRCVFPNISVPVYDLTDKREPSSTCGGGFSIKPGDYVAVRINRANGTTLRADALGLTTLTNYHKNNHI